MSYVVWANAYGHIVGCEGNRQIRPEIRVMGCRYGLKAAHVSSDTYKQRSGTCVTEQDVSITVAAEREMW